MLLCSCRTSLQACLAGACVLTAFCAPSRCCGLHVLLLPGAVRAVVLMRYKPTRLPHQPVCTNSCCCRVSFSDSLAVWPAPAVPLAAVLFGASADLGLDSVLLSSSLCWCTCGLLVCGCNSHGGTSPALLLSDLYPLCVSRVCHNVVVCSFCMQHCVHTICGCGAAAG